MARTLNAIKQIFNGRPVWMNAIMLFCAYMTFIYMPFDMFIKPVAEDQEVWFGITLTGWYAKATEPIHWLIYGAGFYGFLKMKSWMWPWASVYVMQIAIAMLVWSLLDERADWTIGAVPAVLFTGLAFMLWRVKPLFRETEMIENQDPPNDSQTSLND